MSDNIIPPDNREAESEAPRRRRSNSEEAQLHRAAMWFVGGVVVLIVLTLGGFYIWGVATQANPPESSTPTSVAARNTGNNPLLGPNPPPVVPPSDGKPVQDAALDELGLTPAERTLAQRYLSLEQVQKVYREKGPEAAYTAMVDVLRAGGGAPTEPERRMLGLLAMETNRLNILKQQIDELMKEAPHEPFNLILAGEYDLRTSDLEGALTKARDIIARQPNVFEARGLPPQRFLLVLADRLSRAGRLEDALALFPEAQASRSAELMNVRMQLLAGLQRFGEAERLLGLGRDNLSPYVAARLQAALAFAQQRIVEGRRAWQQAWEAASTGEIATPSAQLELARLAMSSGQFDLANSAFDTFLATPGLPNIGLDLWMERLGLAMAQRDMAQTERVARTMGERFPNEPLARNNLLYLRALVSPAPTPEDLQMAAQLAEGSGYLPFQTTYSLLLARANRGPEALGVLDRVPRNWPQLPDNIRLVRAIVLQSAGQTDLAQTMAAGIREANVLPAEWELLRKAIGL